MNNLIGTYLRLLRSYLIPQSNQVLLLALLLFVSIGFQLLSPQVIRYFIDTVEQGGAQSQLVIACVIFLSRRCPFRVSCIHRH